MTTLAERVTKLADDTTLPIIKIALVAQALTAIGTPLPSGADPTFKSVNASHQLALAVVSDPQTYTARAWLVIVASDDPLISTGITDDLVSAAVLNAWPVLAGG